MGEKITAVQPQENTTGASRRRLKIAYYCVNDPLDKRSWSGITYYLGQSLQRNVGDVDFLGPIQPSLWVNKTLRAVSKLIRLTTGKEYNVRHSLLLSWHFAIKMKQRLKGRQYDCIVAPAAATELALLRPSVPVIYVSDTTFQLISHFYIWEYGKIPGISRWEGNWIERKALHNSVGVIVSSRWAAESVTSDYGYPASRILTIPLGANMDFVPSADAVYQKLQNKELTLLYLAVEWERKGGPLAFQTLLALHQKGIPARLIVCGCIPPESFRHSHMEVIPFLNKNKKEDHGRFVTILTAAHFLLLPTRADCSLLVACEANAYGVPAITTNVGGVSDVVVDGVNGFCLPKEAEAPAYAECISSLFTDPVRYRQLIHSSRLRFEQRLNWDQWAVDFIRFYEAMVKPRQPIERAQ